MQKEIKKSWAIDLYLTIDDLENEVRLLLEENRMRPVYAFDSVICRLNEILEKIGKLKMVILPEMTSELRQIKKENEGGEQNDQDQKS